MKLSVVIITLNEAMNITDCLQSVKWADEIIILDSGSIDETLDLAQQYTHKIYRHPFTNFSEQKNRALSYASGDWILLIDADERVPIELANEIRNILNGSNLEKVYGIKRETYFFGKRLRYSGTQDDYPLRFFPKSGAVFVQPVHEMLETKLPIGRLQNHLIHCTTREISHYQNKLKQYIPLELIFMREQKRKRSILDLFLRPAGQFVHLYFIKLGFLDGLTGLQFAVLSAYYSYYKYREYLHGSEPCVSSTHAS